MRRSWLADRGPLVDLVVIRRPQGTTALARRSIRDRPAAHHHPELPAGLYDIRDASALALVVLRGPLYSDFFSSDERECILRRRRLIIMHHAVRVGLFIRFRQETS